MYTMDFQRVLSIHELQMGILNLLRDNGQGWKSDMISVACSGRFWNDVAMDMIWEELNSVNPLLKLIPEKRREARQEKHCHQRFDLYAGRVKRLTVRCDKDLLSLLRRCGELRLPNLRSFVWDWSAERWVDGRWWVDWTPTGPDVEHAAVALSRLLMDKLERFEITGTVPTTLPEELTELFKSLCDKCGSLKAIKLSSSKFCRPSTIIEPLAHMPGLESLWLYSGPLYQDGLEVEGGFQSLRSLRLETLSVDSPWFLDSIVRSLRSFTVTIHPMPDEASIPIQIACLARLSNLTRLWIFLDTTTGGSELLTPLLALNSIKELRVAESGRRGATHFLSTDVAIMAQSWPWLRSLIIAHHSLTFDLRDLRAFAAFANLMELRLNIRIGAGSFDVDPEWKSTSRVVIFDMDISTTYRWNDRNRGYQNLAKHVHSVFPGLQPMIGGFSHNGWSGLPGDESLQRALYEEIFSRSPPRRGGNCWGKGGRPVEEVRVEKGPKYEDPDEGSYRESDIFDVGVCMNDGMQTEFNSLVSALNPARSVLAAKIRDDAIGKPVVACSLLISCVPSPGLIPSPCLVATPPRRSYIRRQLAELYHPKPLYQNTGMELRRRNEGATEYQNAQPEREAKRCIAYEWRTGWTETGRQRLAVAITKKSAFATSVESSGHILSALRGKAETEGTRGASGRWCRTRPELTAWVKELEKRETSSSKSQRLRFA
ncbi:hypothetical protein JAAARDRAFT_51547 [Jaapia argillacea MUCL 33604]|uniref:F-box domain-containing protein n=1 Tax=Jaapia argillacea MUCL 33604 TaxID=933084 RepID=A0A067PHD5_9AGAM|nr:hypothetical protein JAAARDRAFT_51547 [Jaapia argillacea MUCL 33604]